MNARSVVALGVLLAVSGCSDSGPVSGGAPDVTSPTILSIAPRDMFHVDVSFDRTRVGFKRSGHDELAGCAAHRKPPAARRHAERVERATKSFS